MKYNIGKIITNQMVDELVELVNNEFNTVDERFEYHKIIGNKKWLDMTVKESNEKVVEPLDNLFSSYSGKANIKKRIIEKLKELKE